VKVTGPDGVGDYLPDDVASYNALSLNYKPREGAITGHPQKLIGKYLEYPVLHHTIGTKITPTIANDIEENKIDTVVAHEEPPDFTPELVRLRANTHGSTDWMAKLHSSYLQRNLLTDVSRGRESPLHSLHPVPALARGVGFGQPPSGEVGY
jgi:hypothetical protein